MSQGDQAARVYYRCTEPESIFPAESSAPSDWNREYQNGLTALLPIPTQENPKPQMPLASQRLEEGAQFEPMLNQFIRSLPEKTFQENGQAEGTKSWVLQYGCPLAIMRTSNNLVLTCEKASLGVQYLLSFTLDKTYSAIGFDPNTNCLYCQTEGSFFEADYNCEGELPYALLPFGSMGLVVRSRAELKPDEAGVLTSSFSIELSYTPKPSDARPGLSDALSRILEASGHERFENDSDDSVERDALIVREGYFLRAYRIWHKAYYFSQTKLLLNKPLWALNVSLNQYIDQRRALTLEERVDQVSWVAAMMGSALQEEVDPHFERSLKALQVSIAEELALLKTRIQRMKEGHVSIPNHSHNRNYSFVNYPLLRRIKYALSNYLGSKNPVFFDNVEKELDERMGEHPRNYQARIILEFINQLEKASPSYEDYCFVLGKIFEVRNDRVPSFFRTVRRSAFVDALDSVLPCEEDGGVAVNQISQTTGLAVQREMGRLEARRPLQIMNGKKLAVGFVLGLVLGCAVFCVSDFVFSAGFHWGPVLLVFASSGIVLYGPSSAVVASACRKHYRLHPSELSRREPAPLISPVNATLAGPFAL